MTNIEITATTQPKLKMTLAFPFTFDPLTITVPELMEQPCDLYDRAVCETDLTLLQPILYITLRDTSGPIPKYFLYTRGQASGEQRLSGKCSIGLGGHTEEFSLGSPVKVSKLAVLHALAEAGTRELLEEVDIHVSELCFIEALSGIKEEDRVFTNSPIVGKPFILYNPTTDVDKVHIGIAITVECLQAGLGEMEEGVITRGEWLTIEEIAEKEKCYNNPIELETWTKTVIANIMATTA